MRPSPGTAVFLLAGLASCVRSSPDGDEPFRLASFREAGARALLLNEVLLLSFSASVDPSSVTARSISIRAADGAPARGRLAVHRDRVEFHPDPVVARTLDDGGYRPGGAHRVEVAGFPRPDCVRAADGRALARSVSFEFRAVDPSSGATSFLDDTPLRGPRPGLPGPFVLLPVRAGEPVRIPFSEALRPDTVTEAGFALREGRTLSDVPTSVSLREKDGDWIVEIQPLRPVQPRPATYVLEIRDSVRDYGGNPPPLGTRIGRIEFLPEVPPEEGTFEEEFATTANLDPEDAGEDGWAAWTGDGRVDIRVPPLAGDGRFGDWSPRGSIRLRVGETARFSTDRGDFELPAKDLPFAAVDLGPDADLRIEGGGVALVSSASTLVVRGILRRGWTERGGSARFPDTLPSDLTEALAALDALGGPDLALVSAGSLRVEGEVVCEGTLVLAAGGRVVVEPAGRVAAGRLLVSSPGPLLVRGEMGPEPERLRPPVDSERWKPPRALTFACGSRFLPFPEPDFLSFTASGGGNASGRRVVFYGARAAPADPSAPDLSTLAGPFDDPDRLDGYPFLRFRVLLQASPDGETSPPFLDAVRLRFRRGPAAR